MYARAQCSGQYGLPGTVFPPQKWQSVSPGSPIGQRQDGAPLLRRVGLKAGRGWILRTGFGSGARFGFLGADEWRMGEGLAGSLRRCALPMTAFLETPRIVPICEVLCPAIHSRFRSAIFASVQAIFAPPVFLLWDASDHPCAGENPGGQLLLMLVNKGLTARACFAFGARLNVLVSAHSGAVLGSYCDLTDSDR